jgi:ubiquinol-cytochrome c reductase iron-sulfur subunit
MADTAATATPETAGDTADGIRRRDFLDIAAVSAAGIGGLAVVYPQAAAVHPPAYPG